MIGPDGALAPERPSLLARAPWWLLALALAAVLVGWRVATDSLWRDIASRLLDGLGVTLLVTAVSFPLALGLGLVSALGLVSTRPLPRQLATLYVQVVRGLPVLVQIFLVAFVLVPLGVEGLHALGAMLTPWLGADNSLSTLRPSDVPMAARVVAALAFAYGAFEAETLRGGLTSLPRGQAEAARALGLSRRQTLRHVLLPRLSAASCPLSATTSFACSRTPPSFPCSACATSPRKRAFIRVPPSATPRVSCCSPSSTSP